MSLNLERSQSLVEQLVADKVAVITGAGQGIGREIARVFAEAGAMVVAADVNEEGVHETSDLIVGDSQALCVDVADPESVSGMRASVMERYGRIDVLVNNAAIFSTIQMKDFDQISFDEWEQVIRVNLTGTFLCCQAVAEPMRERGRGSIVNVSSATVLSGRPFYLHYVTSKSALVGLTRGLARELGPAGVTVNTIMPGSVDTGIPRDSITGTQAAEIVAAQSIHVRVSPSDVAAATLFLASEGARTLTGQTLVVDGGLNFL
jgi:3-oxoacyl-[acyl-carrier protein] reductase